LTPVTCTGDKKWTTHGQRKAMPPTNKREQQAYMGLMNFHDKVIPNYASKSEQVT